MLTRISLPPQFQGLLRLSQVSRHLSIVISRDKELLPITGAIPQLISLGGALRGQDRLPNIAVQEPQVRMSQREFGIDLNGAL